MPKRNSVFVAARNRTSAGPMANKRFKRANDDDGQKQDFYDSLELNRIIMKLIQNQKSYAIIQQILIKKYSEEEIKLAYEEVINIIESKEIKPA